MTIPSGYESNNDKLTRLTSAEVNSIAWVGGLLEALRGEGDGSIVDLLNAINLNTSAVDAVNGNLSIIIGLLAAIQSESRQRDAGFYKLQLDSVGACCVDVPFPETVPTDICERTQSLLDQMFEKIGNMADQYGYGNAPTVDWLLSQFTYQFYGPNTPSSLTRADANLIASFIASNAGSDLGDLSNLGDNAALKLAVLARIYAATSAQDAYNAIQNFPFVNYGIEPPSDRLLRLFFTQTIMAALYAEPSYIDGAGYSNICGEPPPPEEPDWQNNFSRIIAWNTTNIINFGRKFSPTEGPPDGGQLGVRITSIVAGTFTSAVLYTLPDLTAVGTYDGAGDEQLFTLTSSHTGCRLVVSNPVEGQQFTMYYSLIGFDP